MLQALAIPKTEIKALSGAQNQTQFDYVKQRIFEQTGEIWEWEGAPKDGKWVKVNNPTIAAPAIENPLTDETLTDISKGMNTQEAFKIALQRGYSGNAKSFRDRFDKSGYGEAFGLKRIPHKQGRENWLYFDAKS